jgi:hypothetical protein
VRSRLALLVVLLGAVAFVGAGLGVGAPPQTQCAPAARYLAATTPVAFWSTEARCAIVPAGPGGIFGSENFGNKFPGEAAVYMGIVHVAMYDAAVALEGGYRPYVPTPAAPANTSPEAAIATAAYDTLTGLQPQLAADQTILDDDYTAYMAAIPDGAAVQKTAKQHGIAIGEQVAHAVLALRANDGRERNPMLADLDPPGPGPGVWQPAPGAVLGLRLPGMKPLALTSASQLRPDGPNPLTSQEYAETSTRSRSSVASTAPQGRRSRRARPSSGPTMTSGSGTTACSASPSRAGSTWCRRRGCWRWHTWPGAMR